MDDDLTLLRLQLAWGADEAIALDPIDRLRPLEPRPVPAARTAPAEKPSGTPSERALAVAAQAESLDALRDAVAAFDGCALRDTASNLVFAEGNPAGPVLMIGEPPGRDEDRSGHPFAGPEGELFDQMLLSIGLTRMDVMLTPLLPWRPPGGRPPSAGELVICQPFLNRLICLLKPKRLVIFGAIAARLLLPQTATRRRSPRGWIEISIAGMQTTLPSMVLPGLGEMLKNPVLKRDAWIGLRMLRRVLDHEQTDL